MTGFGDVVVEPLFAEHAFSGDDLQQPDFTLHFTLLVPVRIDGRSTTIAVASPAYRGLQ